MPRHNKYDLLNEVVSAVDEAGWNIAYLDNIDEHPFHLQIYREDRSFQVRIYIWHLTHGGGRARPVNEYRIQVTGIDHFETSPGYKTLILGWWSEAGVFAGFDVRKHTGRLGYSPSIQIREESLRRAYIDGFAPCDKGNGEAAIAFRPDFFVEYVNSLEALHDFGQSSNDLAYLSELAQHPEVNAEDIITQNIERKTTIVSVSKKLRDASFRKRILTAYNFSCAACGVQLKLVEAAHIIPANLSNSTDETCNGLALCSIHHKAYDQSLIAINTDYSILTNQDLISEYKSKKLAGGLVEFTQALRPIILLPPAISERPHVEYLSIANRARGWKT